MAAMMEFELRLDKYCSDLSDMRKELQVYRAVALSEAEQQSLGTIHDLAAIAIDDYIALHRPCS